MDVSKIGNNTYALFRKHKVVLPTSNSWFSTFPGYDNILPKQVSSSIISITPFDYANIIDSINLIITTNDIQKRRIILYLIISILFGAFVPLLAYTKWFLLMGAGIVCYASIFIFITKLILSINNMKYEVDKKIKEVNLKYFETIGVKFSFTAKKNTLKDYPYKLRFIYPLSNQQLELIKQFQQIDKQNQPNLLNQIFNNNQSQQQQQQQQQQPRQQQSSSQNNNNNTIIDVSFHNDDNFGDFDDDNYNVSSSLLQK